MSELAYWLAARHSRHDRDYGSRQITFYRISDEYFLHFIGIKIYLLPLYQRYS